MENGIEKSLDYVAPTLLKFAQQHNLKINKYWHSLPSWRFSFKHPNTGLACIEVMAEGENSLKIYAYWWIDDFDNGIRYSKKYESLVIHKDQLDSELEIVFDDVIKWELESWTEITHGLKEVWSQTFSKENFLKLNEKYPIPII